MIIIYKIWFEIKNIKIQNMDLYELELQNLIEVKIMRINTKKLNELKNNNDNSSLGTLYSVLLLLVF